MKTIKPDVKDVLISLLHERYDSIDRDEAKAWYFPKPDNQTALNAYEAITGKETSNFIWLKLDKEILNAWINALEVVCEDDV